MKRLFGSVTLHPYLWGILVSITLVFLFAPSLLDSYETVGFLGKSLHSTGGMGSQSPLEPGVIPAIGLSVIQEALADQGFDPTTVSTLATKLALELQTPIATATRSALDLDTPTLKPVSATPSPTGTRNGPTATQTKTLTATLLPSRTPGRTAVFWQPPTATETNAPPPTRTRTPSPTATASQTPTATETPTFTPSASPTASATVTATQTPTKSPTISPTAAVTATRTATSSPTPAGTVTQTATNTGMPTETPTGFALQTPTVTLTPTGAFLLTPTMTPLPSTGTATAPVPATPTPTGETITPSPLPTSTGTPILTATPIPSATPTQATVPTPIATFTPTVTAPPVLTPTPTPVASLTATATLEPTFLPTVTPTVEQCILPGDVSGELPSDDAYLYRVKPNANYGAEVTINIRSEFNAEMRGLLQFDLSGIPENATITAAYLYLNSLDTNNGQTSTIYRLTSNWDEESVTWNEPWLVPGGDYDAGSPVGTFINDYPGCAIQVDLTGLVGRWVDGTYENYGILISAVGPRYIVHYASKDDPVNLDLRPRLLVVYSVAGGTD